MGDYSTHLFIIECFIIGKVLIFFDNNSKMGSTESKPEAVVSDNVEASPYEQAVKLIDEAIAKNHHYVNFNIDGLKELPPIPEQIINIDVFKRLEVFPRLHDNVNALYLNGCDFPELDTSLIPKYIRYLSIDDCRIQSIKGNFYDFKKLNRLDLSDNKLASLPKLPKYLTSLYCYNNQLTSLPELPDTLYELYCPNNQLTSLPKLPPKLTFLNVYSNQLTSLPKLPASLEVLNIYNNKIEKLPKFKPSLNVILCNNPGSDKLCNINKVNPDNITKHTYKGREFSILTIKKGTVLFQSLNVLGDVKKHYIGIKIKNDYVINSDHETYFFLHPFNVGYGDNTIMYELTNDVKVILGINPGEDSTKMQIARDYGQDCTTKEHPSLIKGANRAYMKQICIEDEFIKQFPDVLGWLAPDDTEASRKHNEYGEIGKYAKYVSYYENKEGVIARPELAIYPLRERSLVDIITPVKEVNERWIDQNLDRFNYKPIVFMDDNLDSKEYKSIMDKLLSKKGYNGINLHRSEVDGFYYRI
jgi:hypothetical protein